MRKLNKKLFAVILTLITFVGSFVEAANLNGRALLIGKTGSVYTGFVATRGAIPFALSAGLQSLNSRKSHIARDNITSLQLVYGNWFASNTPSWAEAGSGATLTFKAAIEYPAGTFTRVNFSGSASASVANTVTVTSDATTVAIPLGARFWTRTFVQNQSGANGLLIGDANDIAYDSINVSAGVLSDLTMGGTVTNNQVFVSYGPIAIIGQTRKPSVLIIGDSRVVTSNVTPNANSDNGEVAMNIGTSYGYSSISGSGWSVNDYAVSATQYRLNATMQYASHIVLQLGINDVVRKARTDLQLRADIATLLALLPVGVPVWSTTMPPYSNGSNTGPASVPQNAERVSNNNWRRTVPTGFSGNFEVANVLEVSPNGGYWGNVAWTSDFLHETALGLSVLFSSGAVNPSSFHRP